MDQNQKSGEAGKEHRDFPSSESAIIPESDAAPDAEGYYRFSIAGHVEHTLTFFPGPSRCGLIADGVALAHGKQGTWVVRYKDLQTMYELATAVRTNTNTQETNTLVSSGTNEPD